MRNTFINWCSRRRRASDWRGATESVRDILKIKSVEKNKMQPLIEEHFHNGVSISEPLRKCACQQCHDWLCNYPPLHIKTGNLYHKHMHAHARTHTVRYQGFSLGLPSSAITSNLATRESTYCPMTEVTHTQTSRWLLNQVYLI